MKLSNNNLYLWPMAADALAIVLWLLFFIPLRELFAQRTAQGWLVVAAVYLLFGFGFNGLKKLRSAPTPEPWLATLNVLAHPKWGMWAALLMAVAITLVQADLNQLVESAQLLAREAGVVHEGEVSLYYAFGPTFLWVIIALFYVLVVATRVEERYEPGTAAYALRLFWGVLCSNSLALVLAAYAGSLVGRLGRPLTTAEVWLTLGGALLAAGLLIDPTRLYVLSKQPRLIALLSYVTLMLFCLVGIVL